MCEHGYLAGEISLVSFLVLKCLSDRLPDVFITEDVAGNNPPKVPVPRFIYGDIKVIW